MTNLKCGLYDRPCPRPPTEVLAEVVEAGARGVAIDGVTACSALACRVHRRGYRVRRYGDTRFIEIDDPLAKPIVEAALAEQAKRDRLAAAAAEPGDDQFIAAMKTGELSPRDLRAIGKALIKSADLAEKHQKIDGKR